MTWTEATGQRPGDLGIYEQHQRRIRIVARQPVRDAADDLAQELLLPVIERIPTI
jgi:DNA-directed RNA polymerase specialized sigma24 family protein